MKNKIRIISITFFSLIFCNITYASLNESLLKTAQIEKPELIKTLKEVVSIETGSHDIEGLDKMTQFLVSRFKQLGATQVDIISPSSNIQLDDTSGKIGKMVQAKFVGKGTKKILLIAHMDTVYPRGTLLKQPLRTVGDRMYGVGIADDKHGIALILHVMSILNKINFKNYGLITILINGDEEIGSPASNQLITKLGKEHDAVFSFEKSNVDMDKLSLTTSGIASAKLTVYGRSSHAGSAPEKGVNALYEMAYQILQARNLSQPERGIKVNWTLAQAGIVINMIPPTATAYADIRVLQIADFDEIEKKLRELIKNKLLTESRIELLFKHLRPPLIATQASRALAKHAQQIYRELGKNLIINERSLGGGTDAAFAALQTQAPVIESFGLQGYGAHSMEDEYILISSIEPRLYLASKLIMDFSSNGY